MPTRDEIILGVVLEFLDPRESTAPATLMLVSRFLYEKGKSLNRDDVSLYTSASVVRSVLPGGGRDISSVGYVDAVHTVCRSRLPDNIGNHGFSYSFCRPFHTIYHAARGTPNDPGAYDVVLDTCAEYCRKLWRRGKMDGLSLRLHTCDNDATVQMVQARTYRNGIQLGPAFSLAVFPVPEMLGKVHVVFRMIVAGMQVSETTGTLTTSHFTRNWRGVCGDHAELVWKIYKTFFEQGGRDRLFDALLE